MLDTRKKGVEAAALFSFLKVRGFQDFTQDIPERDKRMGLFGANSLRHNATPTGRGEPQLIYGRSGNGRQGTPGGRIAIVTRRNRSTWQIQAGRSRAGQWIAHQISDTGGVPTLRYCRRKNTRVRPGVARIFAPQRTCLNRPLWGYRFGNKFPLKFTNAQRNGCSRPAGQSNRR